jgi:hypothetical protein
LHCECSEPVDGPANQRHGRERHVSHDALHPVVRVLPLDGKRRQRDQDEAEYGERIFQHCQRS